MDNQVHNFLSKEPKYYMPKRLSRLKIIPRILHPNARHLTLTRPDPTHTNPWANNKKYNR